MSDTDANAQAGQAGADTAAAAADAEKWKALARKWEEQAKQNKAELDRLMAAANASKSDTERMAAELAELRQRADEADRRALIAEIAQAKGLTPAQAKWLTRAVGDAKEKEAIEQVADELVADLGQSTGDGETEAGSRPSTRPTAGRPRETLRPGAIPRGDSGGDQPFDESKFLAAVPRV